MMRDWKTTYTTQFQVRTNHGRLVGSEHAIEAAEFVADKGRGRIIYKWIDGRYVFWRQM